MLGFVANYAHPTSTYVAARLVERFKARVPITVWGAGSRPTWIAPGTSTFFVSGRERDYRAWVRRVDVLLCLGLPEPRLLQEIVQTANKRTLLWFILQDDLPKLETPLLSRFAWTICPLRSMRKVLRRRKELRNTCYIPWEPGLPVTVKEPPLDCGQLRLYLPWIAGMSGTLAEAGSLCRLVLEQTQHSITVATRRSLPPKVLQLGKSLSRKYPERFRVLRTKNEQERLLHFASHDLTLWLPCADPLGEFVMESLYRGVPVLASDAGPAAELLAPGRSGLLVPPAKVDWVRQLYPMVTPNFQRVLTCLKDKKDLQTSLRRIYKNLARPLRQRQAAAEASWKALLGY